MTVGGRFIDIQTWKNLQDVEILAMHLWTEERMPIASYDPATRMVQCSRKSIYGLTDDIGNRYAKYYVENVFEALKHPGQWYLDKPEAKLYYVPMPGETPENTDVFERAFGDARWRLVPAVSKGRVVTLPGGLLERPGPRLVEALERLAAVRVP